MMSSRHKEMLGGILSISLAAAALSILLTFVCLAAPDEAYGTVTNVVDASAFDVQIEKADPRVEDRVERVRLADVNSPDMKTRDGPAARDFTYAVLQGKRVYLDIDDLSPTGRDAEGRLVCLAVGTGQLQPPAGGQR